MKHLEGWHVMYTSNSDHPQLPSTAELSPLVGSKCNVFWIYNPSIKLVHDIPVDDEMMEKTIILLMIEILQKLINPML